MTKPLSWGPSRSGYYDAVRGANLLNEDSFKLAANTNNDSGYDDFKEGEWAGIDTDGVSAVKIGASPAAAAYPVVIGFERADVRGSGSTALAIGHGFWIETTGWDSVNFTADDFPAGTACAVENGLLVPATSGEAILAIVKRGAKKQQSYAQKALGKTSFTTLLVEVGPRGFKP